MLYYGRRTKAEEAIECFLRQTYRHTRLIIVNTHPDPVCFEREQSRIEVHNLHPDPFENLNEKYNYGFAQIQSEWWCPWDSDDLWLPWHMTNLVRAIPTEASEIPYKVGIKTCYFAEDNKIYKVGWNMWGNCIYQSFGPNRELTAGCDQTLPDNCDSQTLLKKKWKRVWLPLPRSHIFRWDQEPHGSAYLGKEGLEYQKRCREKMYAIRNPAPLHPHWEKDYVKEVEEFEESL
jgi:hypothetical protein